MAKETGKRGSEQKPDTGANSKIARTGKYGEKGDYLYVDGIGLCISRSAVDDLERAAVRVSKEHGNDTYNPYHQIIFSEDAILGWADVIRKTGEYKRARNTAHVHEEKCYPGTDTVDPEKNGSKLFSRRDDFRLDRSESGISIHVTSGDCLLNASSVRHQHFVSLHLYTPDGNRYGELSLTFDQFAAALVSNMVTPCTWRSYWEVTQDAVELQEVVKAPESIGDRMEKRLEARMTDVEKRLDTIVNDLAARAAEGKSLSKTMIAELIKDIGTVKSHLVANRDFTVEQAREEVSGIVEQAAVAVAFDHKLTPEEILGNSHMAALLETLIKPDAKLGSKLAGLITKKDETNDAE